MSNTNRATVRLAVISTALLAGESVMSNEQPNYEVLLSNGDLEYRQYAPYLIAETVIQNTGGYKEAGTEGFKRLFAYISGANRSQAKISMTTPVASSEINASERGEKIAMTTPVQQSQSSSGWIMSFTLPAEFDLGTAPQPTDDRVYLRVVPDRLLAVRRFSSRWTEQSFERQEKKLRAALESANLMPLGKFERAVYNAPFSLPFTRRNEVMVAVSELPAASAAAISLSSPALAAQ